MRTHRLSMLLLASLFLPLLGQAQQSNNELKRPKLVVGIIIDQMRWDYLYRYYHRYGDTGFRRMLSQGFSFENCMLPYIPSYTAIGHSTVYTGSVPSITGIAGNDFIDQKTGKVVYCTSDSTVFGVGGVSSTDKAGKMSPRNMKVTSVADQLRYATNFRSKVVGVALKDRGSILPAGHAATSAYWFHGSSGKWITSSYYTDKLPKWLEEYNAKNMPAKYLAQDWNPSYPIDTYTESASIQTLGRYEGEFKGYPNFTFPLKTSEMVKNIGAGTLVQSTPYGDNITVDVAKLAIENEQLGANPAGATDFLAVSFSSPDKMAHQFTLNSILTEDAYIKLDKLLGDFFSYLDKNIGKGNYLVFLTADHAGTPNAQFMNDNKLPGMVWPMKSNLSKLNAELNAIYGRNDLVRSLMNYQVHFNYPAIASAGIDLEKLKADCIALLQDMEGVMYAVDMKKVRQATIPELIKEKIINGYNHRYSGEIQIIVGAGVYEGSSPKGGTHGTWAPDDAHIPFLMMGWGVPHGETSEPVYMTDIAPTVAAMLRIQMPNGSIGTPRNNFFK